MSISSPLRRHGRTQGMGYDVSLLDADHVTRLKADYQSFSFERRLPTATVLDATSKGPDPWVRFSPFYPHGGIPIPNTPGQTAASVEGLWQGLKVFADEDVDPRKWAVTTMRGIKRSARGRGEILGHRYGVGGDSLLG